MSHKKEPQDPTKSNQDSKTSPAMAYRSVMGGQAVLDCIAQLERASQKSQAELDNTIAQRAVFDRQSDPAWIRDTAATLMEEYKTSMSLEHIILMVERTVQIQRSVFCDDLIEGLKGRKAHLEGQVDILKAMVQSVAQCDIEGSKVKDEEHHG